MLFQKYKNWYLFGALIGASCLLFYAFSRLLLTKDIYYSSFQDQLEHSRIDELFNMQAKYVALSYLFIPPWLLLKTFIISLCLQTGLLLNNTKLKFSQTFGIALTAEFVFLLPQLIKLCWFLVFKTEYTLTDVQQFYPLSVLSLFNRADLSVVMVYPFQTLNIFELLYWILLAGGIKEALSTDMSKGIKVVFSGYIPALILWIIFMVFITVSLSPAT